MKPTKTKNNPAYIIASSLFNLENNFSIIRSVANMV